MATLRTHTANRRSTEIMLHNNRIAKEKKPVYCQGGVSSFGVLHFSLLPKIVSEHGSKHVIP
jgi:hypothetical protein